jgi:hypothetical protein
MAPAERQYGLNARPGSARILTARSALTSRAPSFGQTKERDAHLPVRIAAYSPRSSMFTPSQ